jgi:hypothetical protein
MNVKVDFESMTLKIMDCDPLEGNILEMTDGKLIEMVLVDSSTEEDHIKDYEEAEKLMEEAIKSGKNSDISELLAMAKKENI